MEYLIIYLWCTGCYMAILSSCVEATKRGTPAVWNTTVGWEFSWAVLLWPALVPANLYRLILFLWSTRGRD